MRILIATPLYPPDVGGPSYYAKGLEDSFTKGGHSVTVASFGPLLSLPMGVRHVAYLLRLLPQVLSADMVIALDTFSAAVPAVFLAKLFRKKIMVRTGGDFLWEAYLERTKEQVPLKDFYTTSRSFTKKERLIFSLTRYVVRNADMIFSTKLQRDIWIAAYGIEQAKTLIIENAFGTTLLGGEAEDMRFMWNVRPIHMKNPQKVHAAFALAQAQCPSIVLDEARYPKTELLERMRTCRAVMLPSFTEISPNFLIDAVRMHKPFIIDKYCGLIDLLGPYGTIVDPLDENDIARGILELATEDGYRKALEKVSRFSYDRSYDDVAADFLKVS